MAMALVPAVLTLNVSPCSFSVAVDTSTRPALPPRSPRAIRSYTTHSDLTEEGGFPIGADVEIRVTYLRDDKRWSPDQRNTHRMVQCRKARDLSSAKNRASAETSCKPKLAISSTNSLEPVPLVAVA